jgi:DNA-binding NtrC family response regulator
MDHPARLSDLEVTPHVIRAEPAAARESGTPIGDGDAFRRILRKIERYARFDIPVLLEGESGTGKTILARYLHDRSDRAAREFLPLDLGALDDELAGSALFGHIKGSYTGAAANRSGLFAEAHGGTVFLDEIGKASASVQRRLLRVVDSGELTPVGGNRAMRVNVRVVSATNIPLDALVESGRFLPDLAARIRACTIILPPLREHREDIPALVRHFVVQLAPRTRYARTPAVDDRLMLALTRAPWRDNVRGLAFAVQRLLIEAHPSRVLRLQHCDDELRALRQYIARPRDRASAADVRRAVKEHGSPAAAARALGMGVSTIYRVLKEEPGDEGAEVRKPI